MGLRINTNVLALNAQHKLQKTTAKLATSLERLSSGLRINSGKDDVVGLLKSESLRTQIRGIAAAESNLANASNLLGVAEGSLAQLTDVAQRIREAAVQGADQTISTADRNNLTTGISDLVNEFQRLATAAEFDGVKLLTGQFTAKKFQVGPNGTDNLSITLGDARTSAIGRVAVLTAETLTNVAATASALALGDPAGITINSVSIASTSFGTDGVSQYEATDSAIAYVNAINSYSGQTGVSAVVLANAVTLTYTTGEDVTNSDKIYINGVAITQQAYSASDTGAQSLVTAINEIASQTGVSATIDTANDKIVLLAEDGRNISVEYSAGSATSTTDILFGIEVDNGTNSATDFAVLYRSSFKLYSDDVFTVAGANAEFASSDSVTQALNDNTTLDDVNVGSSNNAVEALFILDNVIRQLQTKRAEVGSKAIRFSIAEAELQVRKENLTASESRIRDADIAVETANLTAAQILQQAGASVLAQANQSPQIALSLLNNL